MPNQQQLSSMQLPFARSDRRTDVSIFDDYRNHHKNSNFQKESAYQHTPLSSVSSMSSKSFPSGKHVEFQHIPIIQSNQNRRKSKNFNSSNFSNNSINAINESSMSRKRSRKLAASLSASSDSAFLTQVSPQIKSAEKLTFHDEISNDNNQTLNHNRFNNDNDGIESVPMAFNEVPAKSPMIQPVDRPKFCMERVKSLFYNNLNELSLNSPTSSSSQVFNTPNETHVNDNEVTSLVNGLNLEDDDLMSNEESDGYQPVLYSSASMRRQRDRQRNRIFAVECRRSRDPSKEIYSLMKHKRLTTQGEGDFDSKLNDNENEKLIILEDEVKESSSIGGDVYSQQGDVEHQRDDGQGNYNSLMNEQIEIRDEETMNLLKKVESLETTVYEMQQMMHETIRSLVDSQQRIDRIVSPRYENKGSFIIDLLIVIFSLFVLLTALLAASNWGPYSVIVLDRLHPMWPFN